MASYGIGLPVVFEILQCYDPSQLIQVFDKVFSCLSFIEILKAKFGNPLQSIS